ncbi:MAG: hypothetical protein DME82_02680 [Verrucomicrobia bacterium]|nr:MAG: hypothetical protein DME82_02680 [Verrucomicrobiota bacterium]
MRWLRLLNGQVSKQLLHEAANYLLRATYYSRRPINSVFLTIKKRREDASARLKLSRNQTRICCHFARSALECEASSHRFWAHSGGRSAHTIW